MLKLLALILGGIALVEEAVCDLDPVRQVLAGDVLVHRVERNWPEERAGLDSCPERPVENRVERGILAVDRDDGDILSRLAPRFLKSSDGADGHLVVVSVDSSHLWVRLQQRL